LQHWLLSFKHHVSSCRVDVHTDSLALKSALENDGSRNSGVNNFLKDVFDCCREFNFSLDVYYVPSSGNPADFPPGKFPTWIVCCQRGLGGRSNVSLGLTPSTLRLWMAIVNVMEQASACPTSHLVQLRVQAELMFLHSLCLWTTTCTISRHLSWNKIFMVRLLSLSWT